MAEKFNKKGRPGRRYQTDPLLILCMLLLFFFAAAAVFAPWFAPNDPNEIHYTAKFAAASHEFPLGADHMGRCLLSRILYGSRLSLGYAFLITAVSAVFGTVAGMASGYLGGWTDRILMQICDVLRAFPGIVIVLITVGIFGTGLPQLCLAMLSARWVWYARVARNLTRAECQKPVVMASRMAGSSHIRILKWLIFPAVRLPLLSVMTLQFSSALTALAGYSFLGFGALPPSAEWGMMIQDGRAFISVNPSMVFWPGFAIMTVALSANLLGDRLQELNGEVMR